MKKSTKKTLIRGVALIVAFVAVVGAVSFIGRKTNGTFEDITLETLTRKDLNEDNLYNADLLTIEKYNAGTALPLRPKLTAYLSSMASSAARPRPISRSVLSTSRRALIPCPPAQTVSVSILFTCI